MLKNLSFRQKTFLSQFFIFALFLLFLFPFGERVVQQMVRRALEQTTEELIAILKRQNSEESMANYLQNQELFVFFRVSLIGDKYQLLYDSHLPKHLGAAYQPFYPAAHKEVVTAFKTGTAYNIDWSETFHRKFAYVAVRFSFQDNVYVLRTSFPFTQIAGLIHNFQIGLFSIDIFFMLFFSIITWFIFNRLSRPIHEIIGAIKPYQEGRDENIPQIHLRGHEKDDFGKLAATLNSLSEKVRTQIRTVLEERNEKEAILESLMEGVIAVDGDGIVRYINFTASKMLGMPKRHLLNRPLPLGDGEEKEPLFKKCGALLRGAQEKDLIVTDSIRLGAKQKVYLDLIAAPKPFRSGAILVLQDKSSNYKVLEMGKDFVANASHELRTPITIVRGFAETLQDLPQISPSMLADITEKIVRNCQRMDTLVKNLLTLADIENLPERRFQPCDIVALVESCRYILLSIHPDAQVEIIHSQERIEALADPDLLELALTNLFNNATKYSKPPAFIRVEVRQIADEVEIKVIDRGIGIPDADQPYIFERFYTVDKARSRALGGAGLGLSIVKTIIEKHDGTISVASKVGHGTTFTIVLPKTRRYDRG